LLERQDPLAAGARLGSESEGDLRGWEWRFLSALSRGDEESVLPISPLPVLDAAFVGNGRQLVTALSDGTVQLHGLPAGSVPVRKLGGGGATNQMARIAVSRDTERLAVVHFDLQTTNTVLHVIERAGWGELSRFTVAGAVANLAFSADGSHLVLAVMRRAATRLETEIVEVGLDGSGRTSRVSLPSSQRLNVPVFSPDGSRFAYANDDGTLSVRGVAAGSPVIRLRGHDFEPGWVQLVTGLEFSPDGRFLVSGGVDKTARLWDLRQGTATVVLQGHSDAVLATTFSPDGRRVATSSRDRTVRIWDVATGHQIGLLRSRDSVSGGLAYSPNGNTLVSVCAVGEVRFWNVPSAVTRSVPPAEVPAGSLWAELLPDGLHWWSSTPQMEWSLHRLGDPNPMARIADTNLASLRAKTYHPATHRLAYYSRNGLLTLQDLNTGKRRTFDAGRTNPVATVRFSPDGRLLAIGLGAWFMSGTEGTNHLQVWDVEAGRLVREFSGAAEIPVFSPDNRWLASSDSGGRVQLNDVLRGGSRLLGRHSTQVPGLAFSADSTELASGCTDGSIKLWSVASASELATLESQTSGTLSVAFSPDATRLFAGSLDGVVQVWDLKSRLRLASLHGHRKGVTSLAFRDADTLVSGGLDEIRAWHADPQPHGTQERARM
jgi:WD40 repeat protein